MRGRPTDFMLLKPTLDPESRTASANGRGVNCQGFTRLTAIFHLGAHDRTTGDETVEFKLESSTDDAATDAYAAISGATTGAIGNVVPNATSGNLYTIEVNLDGKEQYIRGATVAAGTTPIDLCSAVLILSRARYAPPTQDNTVVSVS